MRASILLLGLGLMTSPACNGNERSAPNEPASTPHPTSVNPASKATTSTPSPAPVVAGTPTPPSEGAPDVVQLRKDLAGLADSVCACSDATCARKPSNEFSVWQKELITVQDRPEYQPYVAAVNSDAEITAARAHLTECSRKIKW